MTLNTDVNTVVDPKIVENRIQNWKLIEEFKNESKFSAQLT